MNTPTLMEVIGWMAGIVLLREPVGPGAEVYAETALKALLRLQEIEAGDERPNLQDAFSGVAPMPPPKAQEIEAIPVSDIEAQIAHIKDSGAHVREVRGDWHEARCRELAAMYLTELIASWRADQKLKKLAREISNKHPLKPFAPEAAEMPEPVAWMNKEANVFAQFKTGADNFGCETTLYGPDLRDFAIAQKERADRLLSLLREPPEELLEELARIIFESATHKRAARYTLSRVADVVEGK